MKKILNKTSFAEIVFILSVIISGAFYEYLSCFLSAAMFAWLVFKTIKEKKLKFNLSLTSISILVIIGFYLISIFWAVDKGMALIGFLKFLPVILYVLILMQKDDKETILSHLPYIAAIITIISVVGMQIPKLSSFFSVADRLAGPFQYPNTFALFLLVAEILVFSKEKLSVINIITVLVLLFGIFYTGSRAVLVLTAVSNFALIFILKNKTVKIALISEILVASAGLVIYALIKGGTGAFGRILSISFNQSTFLGRLLYFGDALPLILKHPFGTGYMGYSYLHKSVQTGVYSVMYVHNDFLQLILDVGWIPFLAFAAALIKSVVKKGISGCQRLMICVIAAHCCFDFDLQFISMFILLLLLLDRNGTEKTLTKSVLHGIVCAAFAVINIYSGIALMLSHAGKYEISQKLYPFNTQNECYILMLETNVEKADMIANDIIRRNENVSAAYSIKAKAAFSKGDFGSVIKYKNRVFELSPFDYKEYEEYCYMLIKGIELYKDAGDSKSARICVTELLKTADTVKNLSGKLSKLGTMIDDQPRTDLPDDINEYINSLK